jgi:DNA-binding LacI/PurR family transcriptional regulator
MADRVTIVDVARAAGVSISTVSTALSGQSGVSDGTRERIRQVADTLGWVPSLRGRSLSRQRAFAVGLVIQRSARVIESDPFFAGFIGGVESVLEGSGYAMVLQVAADPQHVVDRYERLARDHRVDGAFITDVMDGDPRFDLCRRIGLPFVAVNTERGGPGTPAARQDHAAGLSDLVKHLVSSGHRRIAHVSGAPGYIHTRQREETWRNAVRSAGLRPGPCFIGDFSIESGSRAATALLRRTPRPTAVTCANDLMAIGFIAGAAAMGLSVPEDVSVCGFDGIELGSYVRPQLATVRTNPHDLGSTAAAMLLRRIEGQDIGDEEIEPAAMRLGASVGPPPH